jgi:hypothetical protein
MASTRITSEGIYVEFLPFSTVAPATAIWGLNFDLAVDGGTFKLWVNGESTADITMTGTALTDVAAINAALDALDNLTAGDLVASGATLDAIIITATGSDYLLRYIKLLAKDVALTQSTPNSNEKMQVTINTQGTGWVRVSDELSAFDFEAAVDTVDLTSISEYFRTHKAVAESLSGTASFYKDIVSTSVVQVQLAMAAGNTGWLRLFPEGKILGKEVISFEIIVENFGEDYPDHEKVEQEASFMRLGEWIDYPSSIWRG